MIMKPNAAITVASVNAARHPDRVALAFRDWSWTYGALDQACDSMVTVLREAGIVPGTRVAYLGKNNDLFFVTLFGVIRAGAVLVPVNWRNTAPETRFVLEDSDAKLIIADAEFLPLLKEADETGRAVLVVDDPSASGLRACLAAAAPAPRAPLDPFAPSLQLYTSGTTGKPKGVLTSQHALAVQRQAEFICPAFDDWGDDEVLLSPLPAFHVGGMSWVQTGLVRGQSVYLTADLAPAHILDLCIAHGITRTFLVPTLVRALIEEMHARDIRVATLRGIHYGAASMDPQLLERSVDNLGCRFLQYYGMTEATGTITILDPADRGARGVLQLRAICLLQFFLLGDQPLGQEGALRLAEKLFSQVLCQAIGKPAPGLKNACGHLHRFAVGGGQGLPAGNGEPCLRALRQRPAGKPLLATAQLPAR